MVNLSARNSLALTYFIVLQEVFKDLEDEQDEDYELDCLSAALKEKGAQIIGQESEPVQQKTEEVAKKTKVVKKTNETEVNSVDSTDGINEWDVDQGSLASGTRTKPSDFEA